MGGKNILKLSGQKHFKFLFTIFHSLFFRKLKPTTPEKKKTKQKTRTEKELSHLHDHSKGEKKKEEEEEEEK